jgi:YVTN family beta-propeller protein
MTAGLPLNPYPRCMAGMGKGRRRWVLAGAVAAACLTVTTAVAVVRDSTRVGPQPDGTGVLPTGWTVTPAGKQVQIGEKPFGQALSPDGRTLLVSNDGQYIESLQVIDTASGKVLQTIPYKDPEAVFLGVAWSPDGRHAYASAGVNNKIRVYDVSGQKLTETAPVVFPKAPGTPMENPFPGGLAMSADGRKLYVADQRAAAISVVDPASKQVLTSIPVGHNPYTVQLSGDGTSAYVSNWGDNTITVVDTASNTVRKTITVGTHPSALARHPKTGEVLVANSDSDSISVIDPSGSQVTRTIDLAPYPHAQVGVSPNALTVSADGTTLYVANAGNDDVAVVRLAGQNDQNANAENGQDRVLGLIPTAWYPTGVTLTADGKRLLVTNAKGLGAGPNPNGPNPYLDWKLRGTPEWQSQYVGSMIMGTLSLIDVPGQQQLSRYTGQVRRNNGFDQRDSVRAPAGSLESIVPRMVGGSSPIKHVIYVLKENRTFDQVLGDLGRGNGDPKLAILGNSVTPNQHRLSQQFVTLDNFYANGEVSGDGWQWTAGAYANTHNEKTWPAGYGNRYGGPGVDALQVDAPGSNPDRSYIWDRVIDAGLTQRHYGWWTSGPAGSAHADPTAPELDPYVDHDYPSWDLSQHDYNKIKEWQREYAGYEATNSLPAFEMVALINDHTDGVGAGRYTPKALVADNDYALGQLVQTVSQSKDWKDTAIFVVEDDAQAGPDHVDGHRTIAQVISPYTQTGKVDSTLYSTVSMLRTMELILGLKPMTQFDAAATPMLNSFTTRPSFKPYTAVKPQQNMEERNPGNAPMSQVSSSWDFSRPDQAPAAQLNEAIWESVKGPNSHMPAPPNAGKPSTQKPDADG